MLSSVREVKETGELCKEGEQMIVGAVNRMWVDCLGFKPEHLFGVWLAREGAKEEEAGEEEKVQEPLEGGVVLRLGEVTDIEQVS